jgi:hypothetical protein
VVRVVVVVVEVKVTTVISDNGGDGETTARER